MTPRLIQQKVSSDFVKLVLAVIFIVFILSSFFIYSVRSNNKALLQASIEQNAIQLDSSLTQSFNYIIYLMNFLGNQISKNGSDLEYIQSLYAGFKNDFKVKNLSSWSMFDWLTPDKNIRVTSTHGILPAPVDLSDRKNLIEADKEPGTVFFNPPSFGKISHQWIIPISRAVNNTKNKRLGYINLGVSISAVLSQFEHRTNGISYLLFSDDFEQIVDAKEKRVEDSIINKFKNEVTSSKGTLKEPIIFNNIEYTYYYKSDKYPFIFLLGHNPEIQKDIMLKSLILPITLFLVLGLIAVILSYILYKRVILPISKLGIAAQNIAEEKDINISLSPTLPIEITNLANQLNNINFYKKQILNAKENIEAANRAKTEFLTLTAHELRSPLNAIIGMSQVIKTKMFGEKLDSYTEYAGDIEQSGHELLEFITDLIDLSKSEGGDFALDKEDWVDVSNIINRAKKLNISRANKTNIRINVHIQEELPKLFADNRRLRQVLINLISNSIKYSPPDTLINISALVKNKKIAIIVADQGFGMDEPQLQIALSKWGIVKNENSGKVDSSGLGLPLAKYLIELHGAEFLVESTPGKGTKITMIFPKERVKKPDIKT